MEREWRGRGRGLYRVSLKVLKKKGKRGEEGRRGGEGEEKIHTAARIVLGAPRKGGPRARKE